ncbi:type III secretion system export apparatus subunit SctV [Salinicola rhizosphaerae]|uniref:EscV/YscV/HrcV family type III secretion system export apparatus protein n=1 Tax=Salinicola rhizosphaerae TaxID=1443141 RepID=A0ABQ3DRF1_9GAMM|nr:type III secretion system export apparatus subunit SctV [Salinicola rhizosphaerae]GHB11817.1 EscV/YscV/HrcV family type III secretion system export apparatus protein [Salinicola rhizosphaerae]
MRSLLARLDLVARRAAQRSDVIIAAFMVLAVVMMIIPLPTPLVDALIGINIGFSLLILVVAFYISHPVEFSSLPPIILLATLFRLALSITTTRLILLDADAGQIVSAFGNFVIAGEVVIGMVVFLIITVAQFLVITKGSERVAEVAARFTLDAMPGKQMSIDNDLRNGDIDTAEARRRRSRLESESQLYGAMDGAMKFVKGDAIAGLVILFVNLIGGLLIGMLEHDMAFGDAVETYSLLTVGDGLIAQIPALLISIGAGTVVTRVSSDNASDLGSEIVGQLGSNSKALGMTATVLFCAAFIPGFATGVFLSLAALLGGGAFYLRRRQQRQSAEASPSAETETPMPAEPNPVAEAEPATPTHADDDPRHHRVMLGLSATLADELPLDILREAMQHAGEQVERDLGIAIPAIGLRIEPALVARHFTIELDEVPVLRGELPADSLLLDDDDTLLAVVEITPTPQPALVDRGQWQWLPAEAADTLDDAGIRYLTPAQTLERCLERMLDRYAGEFVGIQEARALLSEMESHYAELVNEAVRVVSLQKMAEILRRLVSEGVPVRTMRTILEAMVTVGGQETNSARLADRVRIALARQICHRHAGADRVLPAWVATRPLEEALRSAQRHGDDQPRSALPTPLSRALNSWFEQQLAALEGDLKPVVVIAHDVRASLQQWVRQQEIDLPVIAWQEIAPEFHLQAIAQVRLPRPTTRREAQPQARAE